MPWQSRRDRATFGLCLVGARKRFRSRHFVATLTLKPIGTIHTAFRERVEAPRQPDTEQGAVGRVELFPGHHFEDALHDVEGWEYVWLIYWFNRNEGWRPKVLPPRSERRRGLFSTRSPHRPNPIGLSAVRLVSVEGLILHVRGVDMLDETPLLDIKPYVAYADARPDAKQGWLGGHDPKPAYAIAWSELATRQAAWLAEHGTPLVERVNAILALGPEPHAYRRIRKTDDGYELAYKSWRFLFRHHGDRSLVVTSVASGYRPSQLAHPKDPDQLVHRAFVDAFAS